VIISMGSVDFRVVKQASLYLRGFTLNAVASGAITGTVCSISK